MRIFGINSLVFDRMSDLDESGFHLNKNQLVLGHHADRFNMKYLVPKKLSSMQKRNFSVKGDLVERKHIKEEKRYFTCSLELHHSLQ